MTVVFVHLDGKKYGLPQHVDRGIDSATLQVMQIYIFSDTM